MPAPPKSDIRKRRFFVPILAGATWRDRVIACLGALIGICTTYLICHLTLGAVGIGTTPLPLLVAPMGASAVLLFAVPSSPLAQPWPIIGGNTISAFIGIAVTFAVPDSILAAGISVALAIAVMSLCRCLHPPGGAAALLAVLGGPHVTDAGLLFAFDPVAINAVLITLVGLGYHWLLRHNYPHRTVVAPINTHGTKDAPGARIGFTANDIDHALADLGETFDIDRDDLDRLIARVELRALERSHGNVTCADIMSRHHLCSAGDRASRGEEATYRAQSTNVAGRGSDTKNSGRGRIAGVAQNRRYRQRRHVGGLGHAAEQASDRSHRPAHRRQDPCSHCHR